MTIIEINKLEVEYYQLRHRFDTEQNGTEMRWEFLFFPMLHKKQEWQKAAIDFNSQDYNQFQSFKEISVCQCNIDIERFKRTVDFEKLEKSPNWGRINVLEKLIEDCEFKISIFDLKPIE